MAVKGYPLRGGLFALGRPFMLVRWVCCICSASTPDDRSHLWSVEFGWLRLAAVVAQGLMRCTGRRGVDYGYGDEQHQQLLCAGIAGVDAVQMESGCPRALAAPKAACQLPWQASTQMILGSG